jgi:ribosomal protein RSM22 (predicted rRNA methylase)
MDLCTVEGKIERRIIAKSHGDEGGYKKAKKLNWGDLWHFEKRIPNKFRKEGRFGKRLW